jgi:tetratricopeptide (TPR) repeat protein
MQSKKKSHESKAAGAEKAAAAVPKAAQSPVAYQHSEQYEAALRDYEAALGMLHQGSYAQAMEAFRSIEAKHADEQVLAERARSYARVCERKLAPPRPEPDTYQDLYLLGVVRANEGRYDSAVDLFDRALRMNPGSGTALYARAAANAQLGRSEPALADLRQAVSAEPKLRFQAASDPDFERIRDEAAFIDVIEPTPSGS